jgi:hypothetical protein
MFTSKFFANRFFANKLFAEGFFTKLFASVVPGAALLLMMGSCIQVNTPDCGVTGLTVGPATATVDHTVASPANTQTFSAFFQFKANSGCPAITAALVNSNWIASDPSVHLSSSPSGQVTATCTAKGANPVTISATQVGGQTFSGQATLTCN